MTKQKQFASVPIGTPGARSAGIGSVEVREPDLRHLNDALDEALEESFPASDPIAISISSVPWRPAVSDRAGMKPAPLKR